MIIPIKCFTCGKVLADSYRYYLAKVASQKLGHQDRSDIHKVTYLTPEFTDKTIEGQVLDELKLTKPCCRRHMLCQPPEE